MLLKILGVIILILDIYAIIKIAGTTEQPMAKAIWIALVLVFPMVGLAAWFIAGPGGARILKI